MSRYTFRGLLAELQPEVSFGRAGERWVLTCWVEVPERVTGRPFSVVRCRSWETEPSQDEVDDGLRETLVALLAHEVHEGLGVAGVFQDPHGVR